MILTEDMIKELPLISEEELKEISQSKESFIAEAIKQFNEIADIIDKEHESGMVHLINEVGHKIEVANSELIEDRLSNERNYANYHIDVNWYLANGYSQAEDVFRRIENGI